MAGGLQARQHVVQHRRKAQQLVDPAGEEQAQRRQAFGQHRIDEGAQAQEQHDSADQELAGVAIRRTRRHGGAQLAQGELDGIGAVRVLLRRGIAAEGAAAILHTFRKGKVFVERIVAQGAGEVAHRPADERHDGPNRGDAVIQQLACVVGQRDIE